MFLSSTNIKGPFLLLTCLLLYSAQTHSQEFKGICFSSPKAAVKKSDILAIAEMNANWIAVVPYAYYYEGEIHYNMDDQWKGERAEGIRKTVQFAHEEGMKVMLKPHVWIKDGSYTGRFDPGSEEDWVLLEESFRKYIRKLKNIAIEEEVELFCLGSEWGKFAKQRQGFWLDLIDDINHTYSGKVTYAANWDDYRDFPFWNELDYIGIDSYFPLSDLKNPSLGKLMKGWKTIMKELKPFAKEQNKKIFFPEFGFRSTEKSTIKPWDFDADAVFSEEVQNNAYKTYFESIWKQEWFAGGFIWEWFADHDSSGWKDNLGYSPQRKLAEETIREAYAD